MELLQYNKEWVDFISQSRIDGMETDHDIIYDRMADNQYSEISDALQQYADHEITADEVVKRIQWDNDCADQFCFKNEGALSILKAQEIFIQYKDEYGRWKLKKDKVS